MKHGWAELLEETMTQNTTTNQRRTLHRFGLQNEVVQNLYRDEAARIIELCCQAKTRAENVRELREQWELWDRSEQWAEYMEMAGYE